MRCCFLLPPAGLAFSFEAAFSALGGISHRVYEFKPYEGDPQAAVAALLPVAPDISNSDGLVVFVNNVTFMAGEWEWSSWGQRGRAHEGIQHPNTLFLNMSAALSIPVMLHPRVPADNCINPRTTCLLTHTKTALAQNSCARCTWLLG